jgi:hypothetical protein
MLSLAGKGNGRGVGDLGQAPSQSLCRIKSANHYLLAVRKIFPRFIPLTMMCGNALSVRASEFPDILKFGQVSEIIEFEFSQF